MWRAGCLGAGNFTRFLELRYLRLFHTNFFLYFTYTLLKVGFLRESAAALLDLDCGLDWIGLSGPEYHDTTARNRGTTAYGRTIHRTKHGEDLTEREREREAIYDAAPHGQDPPRPARHAGCPLSDSARPHGIRYVTLTLHIVATIPSRKPLAICSKKHLLTPPRSRLMVDITLARPRPRRSKLPHLLPRMVPPCARRAHRRPHEDGYARRVRGGEVRVAGPRGGDDVVLVWGVCCVGRVSAG